MNKLITLIICALPFASSARTFHHEFGEIKEDGGVVEHTFVIPAEKKAQLVVNAFESCPCVKVKYDKGGVPAGKPLKIVLTYDPVKQKGHFTKPVFLKLSDNRRDTLVVTGTVKRTRPVIDRTGFTEHFGMGFMIDRARIDFGRVKAGSAKTVKVPVLNSYEAGMALDLEPKGRGAEMLTVPYGLKLGPGGKSRFELRLVVPATAAAGVYEAELVPIVHGMKVDPVPVKFTVIK